MNTQDVLGELLYIGIVAEKGRCYGRLWSIKYRYIIRKHIEVLIDLNDVLLSDNYVNIDNALHKLTFLCEKYSEIGKFYNISLNIDTIQWNSHDNNYINVCQLMKKMLEDLQYEVSKILINKNEVYSLLCSLHNLPRVYLGKDKKTLCKLNQHSITEEEALTYAYDNMNKGERIKYSIFFTDFKI